MTERLTYTVEEAGRLLGISRGTAYAAARDGSLPTVRLGARRLLVPRQALERLLAGNDFAQEKTPAANGGQHNGARAPEEEGRDERTAGSHRVATGPG
jgi:excisionase family DNA binding protein